MQKLILFFIISCLFFPSCQEDAELSPGSVCGKEIAELPWLQKIIEEAEEDGVGTVKIYSVEKGGETYIVPFFCCPSCNYVISLLDCNGEITGYLGDAKVSFDDINNPKISQLIWEPEQFKCIDE
ncbi:hypothetical protein [Flexithrix dorotheae]|uniref:hypothetical protein n=1 Tax=Flexithrix dorotheae TaxID=70993 RepID=UPI0003A51194|nr:hypothetical protein [Flexithrix dorotheae]